MGQSLAFKKLKFKRRRKGEVFENLIVTEVKRKMPGLTTKPVKTLVEELIKILL